MASEGTKSVTRAAPYGKASPSTPVAAAVSVATSLDATTMQPSDAGPNAETPAPSPAQQSCLFAPTPPVPMHSAPPQTPGIPPSSLPDHAGGTAVAVQALAGDMDPAVARALHAFETTFRAELNESCERMFKASLAAALGEVRQDYTLLRDEVRSEATRAQQQAAAQSARMDAHTTNHPAHRIGRTTHHQRCIVRVARAESTRLRLAPRLRLTPRRAAYPTCASR